MIIIPAVDIKDGKCVRLLQGNMNDETVFYDSPVTAARKWEEMGAQLLHIVDINGAITGSLQNVKFIEEIISAINIPIQVGGGIRTIEAVESYLTLGVKRVIIGTSAVKDASFIKDVCKEYHDRIIIGIDAKDGMAAMQGWVETSERTAEDCIKEFEGTGVAGIVYTDISRDGMMKGPNIEGIKRIAKLVDIPVIASGGIAGIEDIKKIINLEQYGVCGMIIGKALYTGAISLKEAMRVHAD